VSHTLYNVSRHFCLCAGPQGVEPGVRGAGEAHTQVPAACEHQHGPRAGLLQRHESGTLLNKTEVY